MIFIPSIKILMFRRSNIFHHFGILIYWSQSHVLGSIIRETGKYYLGSGEYFESTLGNIDIDTKYLRVPYLDPCDNSEMTVHVWTLVTRLLTEAGFWHRISIVTPENGLQTVTTVRCKVIGYCGVWDGDRDLVCRNRSKTHNPNHTINGRNTHLRSDQFSKFWFISWYVSHLWFTMGGLPGRWFLGSWTIPSPWRMQRKHR